MTTAFEGLVLLPGMMCTERMYGPQIDDLGRDYPVFTPAFGVHHSVRGIAENLLARIPYDRFALCGLSMGGIVAMEMVKQAADRIERLALCDTNHLADAPERYPIRNRQISDALSGRLLPIIVDEMLPGYFAKTKRDDSHLQELVVTMALELGPEAFVSQSIALRDRLDYSGTLRTYRGRTLVLCGSEDTVCPPARHRAIAALCRDVSPVVVAGAAHIPTLERPEIVNHHLRRWLQS
jgi:pimeloyl-ACP methyl ester carboxylesterase